MPRLHHALGLSLLATSIAALTACGGGDPTAAAFNGTLTDSPIQGVSYTASPSGKSGVTDASGHFQYAAGDTVTFTLGNLTLGTVAATGSEATITPIELINSLDIADATEKSNAVTNLLVLLQSVDVDGNPDNGITIPATVGAALTTEVAAALEEALTVQPNTFATETSELVTLSAAAGDSAAVADPAEALAHFREQFFSKLEGVYTLESAPGNVVFRFDAQGNYIMGEAGESDGGGHTGVERGQVDWLPATGEVVRAGATSLDTNGEWGLSTLRFADGSAEEKVYFAFDGSTVVVTSSADPTHPLRFSRMTEPSGSLLGPWAYNGVSLDSEQFFFFANGRYFYMDPTAADDCGGPGVEYGSYSLNAGFLSFSGNLYDSNGCRGVHDPVNPEIPADDEYYSAPITVNQNGSIRLGTDDGFLYRPDTTLLR